MNKWDEWVAYLKTINKYEAWIDGFSDKGKRAWIKVMSRAADYNENNIDVTNPLIMYWWKYIKHIAYKNLKEDNIPINDEEFVRSYEEDSKELLFMIQGYKECKIMDNDVKRIELLYNENIPNIVDEITMMLDKLIERKAESIMIQGLNKDGLISLISEIEVKTCSFDSLTHTFDTLCVLKYKDTNIAVTQKFEHEQFTIDLELD